VADLFALNKKAKSSKENAVNSCVKYQASHLTCAKPKKIAFTEKLVAALKKQSEAKYYYGWSVSARSVMLKIGPASVILSYLYRHEQYSLNLLNKLFYRVVFPGVVSRVF